MLPIPKMKPYKPVKGSKAQKPVEKPLAIDFDGVIHDKANPIEGMRMGQPINGAKEALTELKNKGYKLIVHTVMATTPSGINAVSDWLDYYKIPYDQVTALKPNALFYIDDKAIKFKNWEQTMGEIYG